MKGLVLRLALVSVCFASNSSAETPPAGQPFLETRYFRFYSHFWVNLHHYLFQTAAYVYSKKIADNPSRIARFLRDPDLKPTPEESAAILAAIAFYEKELIQLDLTFNRRLHEIKTALANTSPDDAPPLDGGEPALGKVLRSAGPVFKKYLWQGQDESNKKWITEQKILVEEIAPQMVAGLEKLYGADWPHDKLRIDLSGSYTHWAGAYTTSNPNHIVISSTRKGYKGPRGLEMVFHESSHLMLEAEEGLIPETIAKNCAARGVPVPKNLWHAILFYTSGELTRRILEKRGLTHELFMIRNGVFEDYHQVLSAHWPGYMDGRNDIATVIDAIIADLQNP